MGRVSRSFYTLSSISFSTLHNILTSKKDNGRRKTHCCRPGIVRVALVAKRGQVPAMIPQVNNQ